MKTAEEIEYQKQAIKEIGEFARQSGYGYIYQTANKKYIQLDQEAKALKPAWLH